MNRTSETGAGALGTLQRSLSDPTRSHVREACKSPLEGSLQSGFPGPSPGVSDSGCLEGGLGMGVSTKLPGDTEAAGSRTTL